MQGWPRRTLRRRVGGIDGGKRAGPSEFTPSCLGIAHSPFISVCTYPAVPCMRTTLPTAQGDAIGSVRTAARYEEKHPRIKTAEAFPRIDRRQILDESIGGYRRGRRQLLRCRLKRSNDCGASHEQGESGSPAPYGTE